MKRAAKPPKVAKARPSKPTKERRSRSEQVETTWLTADGYRLSDRLVAVDRSRSGGEFVAALANEVMDRHIRRGRRGLAVCGAAQGAGVSFVAANLAVTLAQLGVSTLLVDTNLNAPGLEVLFTPPAPGPGLSDLLASPGAALAGTIRSHVLPRLSILYAGSLVGGEADGLGSDRFGEIVRSCLRDHECTIFDTPPANRSTGARLVSAAAGYALLVARCRVTFTDDIEMLTAQLAQDEVSIVGSVLNAA